MIKNNRKKAVAQAISTAVALGWVIMQVESARAATLTVNNLNDSGVGSLRDTINIATSNSSVTFTNSTISDGNAGQISIGGNHLSIRDNNSIEGGTIVGNSGQISSGGNISVSGGEITITPVTLIVTTRVPEPSAIAGTILACSLAWLAKRKQAAFCKTKV